MEIPQQVKALRPALLGPADDTEGAELLWMGTYVTKAYTEFAHEPWIQRALDVVLRRVARRYVRREMRIAARPEHRNGRPTHRRQRRNGGAR